jgi:hypothetical protein
MAGLIASILMLNSDAAGAADRGKPKRADRWVMRLTGFGVAEEKI